MKNLFFCLLVAFVMPQIASSQYYFTAHVYSQDPCCIYIEAGTNGELDNWTVVVDGTDTYYPSDFSEGFILVCYEGNGTHVVEFFVDGRHYWTRIVEITDCEGLCSDCDIIPPTILADDLPGECMTYFMAEDWDHNPDCSDLLFTWNFGDGNIEGPSPDPFAEHIYAEDGTYQVCVTMTMTSLDGEECSVSNCTEVEVTGCDPEEPCCGYELYELFAQTIPQFDPCLVRLSASWKANVTECPPVFEWDLGDDGTIDYTSTTSSSWVFYVDGPGPFIACFTMRNAEGDCSLSDCIEFETPGCEGLDGGSSDRSADQEISWEAQLSVYPNPANDFINISMVQDEENPIERISIVNTAGKIISSQNPGMDSHIMMDVSSLPQGIYMVRVEDYKGGVQIERFVKTQ